MLLSPDLSSSLVPLKSHCPCPWHLLSFPRGLAEARMGAKEWHNHWYAGFLRILAISFTFVSFVI